MSFDDFQKYLNENRLKVNFRADILETMKEYVLISYNSVKHKINRNNRPYTFEIYGYDFIIDSEFKPWIIEVNTNPCIEESSPLLKQLIPRMLDDAFKLTIDVIFGCSSFKSYPVNNYEDNANMWQ